MKQNINKALLNHFNNGGGAAAYLRGLIPDLTEQIQDLFSIRSDIQRVQVAEKLSEKILAITDFSDLIPLRDEVATLEIKRLINYNKQTDHTAHTVYLFLLGIWVYDNIPLLKKEIDISINSNKSIKMFIFQWIFASLLHDVGYLFFNYRGGDNKFSWEKYDDMFKNTYIPAYLSERIKKNGSDFNKLYDEFLNKYNNALVHSNYSSTEELLRQLDNIPWIGDIIGDQKSGLDLLLSCHDKNRRLISFSDEIAIDGYNGNGDKPEVDHAIASGLMLFKYTSVWYWLYKKAEKDYKDLYGELNKSYKYPEEVFINHVIPACRAVIYHNIPDLKCSYHDEPLLYLAILCDELQMWDRFWSGEEYIGNWNGIEHCMAEQIHADIVCNELEENQLHFILSKQQHDKLLNIMDKRLEDWGRFAKLTELKA